MYHKVQGDSSTGSIIQYTKIPLDNDTLILIDTLMNAGKFLYDFDDYFTCAVDKSCNFRRKYIRYEVEDPSSEIKFGISYVLDEFFKIKQIQHKSIYIGKKPYTGSLEVSWLYGNKSKNIEVKLSEFKIFINGEIIQSLSIKFEVPNPDFLGYYKEINDYVLSPLISFSTFNLKNAHFYGSFFATNIFDKRVSSGEYYKNKLDDDFIWNLYGVHNFISDKKVSKEDLFTLESSKMSFYNGKKEGQWALISDYYEDKAKYYFTFHKNKLEGNQYRISKNSNKDYISYVFPMLNDTVNGKVWVLEKNGYLSYSGNFKMGIPDGEFIKYYDLDTFRFFKEKFRFEKGFLIGRYEHYRDSNNLKLTIDFQKSDSLFYTVFNFVDRLYIGTYFDKNNWAIKYSIYNRNPASLGVPNRNGFNFISDIFENPYIKKGFYTYYYKSGTVFKSGLMEDYLPKGRWNFYREGKDRLYKTIDFKDSIVKLSANDSIETFGIVHAYYDDGRLMFKGYATDVSSKYTCESEADIPTEENYYLEFYDTVGNSVLKDGSGFITELQASGHKLKEGQIQNNKKQGIWVYYNNFGQPEAIGYYSNGKKQGRWLVGDLSGLNLSDKVCFMSNEEFLMWVDTYGKNLSLSEEFYNNGVLVSNNDVKTISR